MRIQQIALNTIEVQKGVNDINPSLNKMKSILNMFGLKVTEHSQQIPYEEMLEKMEMVEKIKPLSPGTYIIRTLRSSNNEKLEQYGHTVFYAKEEDFGIYYDPLEGAGIVE